MQPAPYQIPTDGACGQLIAAAGWHELTGCPDESALDRGFLDRVHPEDRGLLDFRGREPSIDALLRHLGLVAEAAA